MLGAFVDDAIFRLSHRKTKHVLADARIYLTVNSWCARYLFIKNFISIAYVLAHLSQQINKWARRWEKGGEEGGGDLGETQFSDRRASFTRAFLFCSRKSPRRLFFFEKASCFFSPFLRSIVGNEEANFAGELSARFAPSGPPELFRFSRWISPRRLLFAQMRAKIQSFEIKFFGNFNVSAFGPIRTFDNPYKTIKLHRHQINVSLFIHVFLVSSERFLSLSLSLFISAFLTITQSVLCTKSR